MIGTTLDGRYRLDRVIGHGGMGSVYEAVHTGTGRRVAIKLIRQMALGDTDVWSRFQREARASSAIDTRHIVQVLDSGRDAASGLPFMAMELLEGDDLGFLLERGGALEQGLALRVVSQACVGLAKAHKAQVVHRDIKPANIFLTEEDEGDEVIVKLLDFGIAKVRPGPLDNDGLHLTQTGKLLGTPLYMSPEQAQGARDIDHRTDIWSMGAVLYEALTGRSPFADAENLGKLILWICSRPPPPPSALCPSVPPELDAIVLKCLAMERADRFESADDLLAALATSIPRGSRIARGEVWRGGRAASAPPGEPPPRISDARVIPSGEVLEDTKAVEEAGVASTLYATSKTQSPGRSLSRHKMAWTGAALLGGVGLAVLLWPSGKVPSEQRAAEGPSPSAAPSATAGPTSGSVTLSLEVVPADAEVRVRGERVPVSGGRLSLSGSVGEEVVVALRGATAERKLVVTLTAEGASPSVLHLEDPVMAPAASAAEAPSASAAPAPRPPRGSATAPQQRASHPASAPPHQTAAPAHEKDF